MNKTDILIVTGGVLLFVLLFAMIAAPVMILVWRLALR